jgi:transcriptional regulator with XRE-family HTH domain
MAGREPEDQEQQGRESDTWLDYGAALRRLRRERAVGLNDLAARAGVSASYLSEVERGFKRPSTDVLARLAVAFGLAPSELLAYIEASGSEGARELPLAAANIDEQPSRPWASPSTRRMRHMQFLEAANPATPQEPSSPMPAQSPGPARAPRQETGRQDESSARERSMQMLARMARGLSDDDLKILLELARRLLERS